MQTVCFAKMHTNHKLPTNHDMMFADGGRKRGIDHELNEEKGEEGGKETGGEGAQHKERGGRRKEAGLLRPPVTTWRGLHVCDSSVLTLNKGGESRNKTYQELPGDLRGPVWSLLWCGFDPWPGNFRIRREWPPQSN